MSEELILGIDLGTTFSAAAFINQYGKPEIIPNREGDRTTPSVIYFDPDSGPIVGKEARNQGIIDPRRTCRFVKREMGNPSFRFNVDGKDYFPEDLSAMILAKIKKDAEAFLGMDVTKSVVSVPAYFKDAQREATRVAGEMAGLEVIRIVNEPTAAALAYGLDRSEGNQIILVYDFGGGTFDVTVMQIDETTFSILATDGDAKLGGKDIDGRLAEYFAEEFQQKYDIDLRAEPHTHQDLWDKAEITKKDLSFRQSIAATIASGEKTLRIDLDREIFFGLIEDLIKQTEDCLNRVVEACSLDWNQIDAILLSGGSSRIPAVREMIKRISGKDAARDMNPDECVALGAAIQAVVTTAETHGSETGLPLDNTIDIVIKDVASHSLGVRALSNDQKDYVNSIVIPRFTQIPCERTRKYTTNEDNQEKVEIEILQGEDRDPRSPDVDLIGKVALTNLPQHRAGELVIMVTLRYDVDGLIEVVAEEQQGGKAVREIVMKKASALESEVIDERKELLERLEL